MIRDEASYVGKLYSFSRTFGFVRDEPCIPLIASELHNVAHVVPVLFARGGSEWRVVGVAADPALRRSSLDEADRWHGDYAPFCLRIHPFRLGPDGERWEVAPEKVVGAPGRGRPFFLPDGTRAPEFAKVVQMLADADRGRATLAAAAARLADAGLLGPVPLLFDLEALSPVLAGLFAVDAGRLVAIPAADLAALAGGSPSPLDLALASVFSLRLLRGHYGAQGTAAFEDRVEALIAGARRPGRDAGASAQSSREAPVPPAAAVTLRGFSLDQSAGLDFAGLA